MAYRILHPQKPQVCPELKPLVLRRNHKDKNYIFLKVLAYARELSPHLLHWLHLHATSISAAVHHVKGKKFLQIMTVNNKNHARHTCSFINPFVHLDSLDSDYLSIFTPKRLGIHLVVCV